MNEHAFNKSIKPDARNVLKDYSEMTQSSPHTPHRRFDLQNAGSPRFISDDFTSVSPVLDLKSETSLESPKIRTKRGNKHIIS